MRGTIEISTRRIGRYLGSPGSADKSARLCLVPNRHCADLARLAGADEQRYAQQHKPSRVQQQMHVKIDSLLPRLFGKGHGIEKINTP